MSCIGKVKDNDIRSRSEIESEQGVKSLAVDAKPCDLPLASLKSGYHQMEGRTNNR